MILANIRKCFSALVTLLALGFTVPSATAAESNEKVYARVRADWPDIVKIQEASYDKLASGKYDQVIGEFDSYAQKNGDWTAYFSISNSTWTIFPDDSFRWMKIAEEKSRQHPLVMLELAMHYMRQEKCPEANQAWNIVEKTGDLKDHLRYLAAYCQIKTGNDAEAMKFLNNPTGSLRKLGDTLVEIWDPPYALARFSRQYQRLNQLDGIALEKFISEMMVANANKATRPMLKNALSQLDKTAAKGDVFNQQAQCMSSWFLLPGEEDDAYQYGKEDEIRRKKSSELKTMLDRCGVLAGKGSMPKDNDIARLLLQRMIDLELATPKQLLQRFEPELKARANSVEGDFGALEILAALQIRAEDRKGLAESDQLGWKRYRSGRFASSRVVGAIIALAPDKPDSGQDRIPTLDAETSAMLAQAVSEFPDEAFLLSLQLKYLPLDKKQRLDALRRLVIAEYHLSPTAPRDIHFNRSALDLVSASREYEKAVAAE